MKAADLIGRWHIATQLLNPQKTLIYRCQSNIIIWDRCGSHRGAASLGMAEKGWARQ